MAFHDTITEELQTWISEQKIFFTGTAGAEGKINVSPKGMDTFRVLSPLKVMWLNLTGSGNETAAHLLENGRITIMFCAFEGKPNILRIYGKGRSIHQRDQEWRELIQQFPEFPSARQIVMINIELIQTSCGFGVPLYDYAGERDQMDKWAENKGEEGIKAYWEEKNQVSLDGKETGILE
jgi:hypothetical protein